MAFTTRLTKVGHGSEHFNERTGMCYHQTPPWERVVGHVRDAGQAKPHLEHNPLSLLGACYATSRRQLNDPGQTVGENGLDNARGIRHSYRIIIPWFSEGGIPRVLYPTPQLLYTQATL